MTGSPDQNRFTDRPFVYVSGKGGVGKSLVAAALAKQAAERGRRTLLVETGERSYFRDFFELPEVDHHPRATGLGFDLALWSGESCLREYVLHLLKLERIYKIFFENKVMRALVNVAPGLNEVAILGKITSGARKVGPPLNYDSIVVDLPATGHALALFRAPRGMAEAIQIGPMAQHSGEMDRLLRDHASSALVVVTLLEELPVAETLEFAAAVKNDFDMPTAVIANRHLEPGVTRQELEELRDLRIGEFSLYAGGLAQQLATQEEQLGVLQKAFAAISLVPRFFSLEPRAMVSETMRSLP